MNDNPATDPLVTEHWRSKQNPARPISTVARGLPLRNAQVTNTNPADSRILIDAPNVNDALAALTYSRELATFLHYMTDGEYDGNILNIKLFHVLSSALSGLGSLALLPNFDQVPLSYPLHSLYLSRKPDERSRGLVIHESSHQVMYKMIGFVSSDITKRFTDQVRSSGWYHNPSLLSTVFLALTEGWAEAFGGIFCGYPEDVCLGLRKETSIEQPADIATVQDGDHMAVKRYSDGIWGDELNWVYKDSGRGLPTHEWHSLDPDENLRPRLTQEARLNRGESSEGAFAMLLYTLFWDFVVGSVPTSSGSIPRYIVPDPSGDPTRSNAWMTPVNRAAISRRFKAFFWEPLKSLATLNLNEKVSTRFLQSLVQHVSQLPASDADWGAVRARLLMWNTTFPVIPTTLGPFGMPVIQGAASNEHSGPLAGGNRVSYTGDNLIPKYTTKAQRTNKAFRSVFMKAYIDGIEAPNFVVENTTRLSFDVPAGSRTGPVDVELRLWVRGVQVWTTLSNKKYTYV